MPTNKRKRLSSTVLADVPSTSTQASTLPSYVDHGDCQNVCEFCGALYWSDERVASAFSSGGFGYNQCCRSGVVALPFPRRPYTTLMHLYEQTTFMANIRAYNSMFSMTSFGAKVDETVNRGSGPYVFKIGGQVHHWIGSLCPPDDERPRFLQMYDYDTENEISNRLHSFCNDGESSLSAETVGVILNVLESCNKLVNLFRNARDVCSSHHTQSFCVSLFGTQYERSYEKPSSGCIGAIVTDADHMSGKFDIIIRERDGTPKRISKLHPLYMALQYPLLIPFGDPG